jgi:hypothetical protein
MKNEDLIKRIDELILLADNVLTTTTNTSFRTVNSEGYYNFRTASLSFLKKIFNERDPYYENFNSEVNLRPASPNDVEIGRGILKAAKDEINKGWFVTVKGIISAEIFSDFLEMADYLLSEGYKDAAAVMFGSVLEEHLRQLCNKHGIPIEIIKNGKKEPKKAATLNDELAGKSVYNKLDQKQVTAWLDLRNKAAHGKYNGYEKEQVELMHQGVMDFMSRNAL